jgi:hypothetical protein
MPTIHTIKIPIPKDWQEFESLVREAMILRWNSPNLQKNGRTGQAQQGVDVLDRRVTHQFLLHLHRRSGLIQPRTVRVGVARDAEMIGQGKTQSEAGQLFVGGVIERGKDDLLLGPF